MLQSVPAAGGGAGSASVERLVLIEVGQCLDCSLYQLDGFQLPMQVPCPRGGAPGFLAPEVVTPRPGPRTVIDFEKNDDWAVGMLLHSMLVGPPATNPFSSGDDPRRFVDADYQAPDLRGGGGYSAALGDITRGLLQVDPAARMDVSEALERLQNDPAALLEEQEQLRVAVEQEQLRAAAEQEQLQMKTVRRAEAEVVPESGSTAKCQTMSAVDEERVITALLMVPTKAGSKEVPYPKKNVHSIMNDLRQCCESGLECDVGCFLGAHPRTAPHVLNNDVVR
jgi:hypothetical protein